MIREARRSNIERIIAIWKEYNMINDNQSARDEISEKILKDPDLLLVYENDTGLVCGVVAGIYDPFSSYIRHLAVDSLYMRRGIATQLVVRLNENLKNRGAKGNCALMYISNKASHQFFKSRGWQQEEDCHVLYLDF